MAIVSHVSLFVGSELLAVRDLTYICIAVVCIVSGCSQAYTLIQHLLFSHMVHIICYL